MKALELIKNKTDKRITFINTIEFVDEVNSLLSNGLSKQSIKNYIDINKKFDVNGMDAGTDYKNLVIAFPKSKIHPYFL